jgi:hypothetical protein
MYVQFGHEYDGIKKCILSFFLNLLLVFYVLEPRLGPIMGWVGF